jgi:predicted transcriptional regulator of viral defense system
MRPQGAPDRAIARIAARQGGVASYAQLLRLGLSAQAIKRRVRAGRLLPLHRGVYAVGHVAIGAAGRRWAAVLALGDDTFVSHATAADAHGIRASRSPTVHLSVRGRAGRKRHTGVRVHRPRSLPDDEVTTLRGLPITTVARTILDLAGTGLRAREVETALNLAELEARLDFAELDRLLARYPRRAGTRSLKAQLDTYPRPRRHPQRTRAPGLRAMRRAPAAAAGGELQH